MRLRALNDEGGWGRDLVAEAKGRGWDAGFFNPQEPASGHLFARIAQNHRRGEAEKNLLAAKSIGYRLIPEDETAAYYEDKKLQAIAYKDWMPETRVFFSKEEVEFLALPFLSKSATGSASRNVRMITTLEQAKNEVEMAFGPGLKTSHKLGEPLQKGYLIWQEFLDGNNYDYRVVIVGRYMMMLRRFNREDVPFASGSGSHEPVTKLNEETEGVLEFARQFFDHFGLKWCGIDVVRDHKRGRWRLLETTLGWKQSAYENCVFFGSKYKGADIWRLLCDEIEAGVFE